MTQREARRALAAAIVLAVLLALGLAIFWCDGCRAPVDPATQEWD